MKKIVKPHSLTASSLAASLVVVAICSALCSCHRTPGEVMDKVLGDFGLRERPEGYVSGSDKVVANLTAVGESEIKRLNLAEQHGTVKFQKEGGLQGKYYKEVKVYENFFPIDAQPVGRTAAYEGGYYGYIDYEYRIYQSERKSTGSEASSENASIATDETGRETYRYSFGTGGAWNGVKGDKTKR